MNLIEQITKDKTCIHTDTGYTGKIIKIAKNSSKMREILIIRYVPRTRTGKKFASSFARGPIRTSYIAYFSLIWGRPVARSV